MSWPPEERGGAVVVAGERARLIAGVAGARAPGACGSAADGAGVAMARGGRPLQQLPLAGERAGGEAVG